jgi:hypothetical protein
MSGFIPMARCASSLLGVLWVMEGSIFAAVGKEPGWDLNVRSPVT